MNDRKIERNNGRCLGRWQNLANKRPIPSKISFHPRWPPLWKTDLLVTAQKLHTIKTFLTLKLSPYRKIGSAFCSSEPFAARSDCHRLGNVLCWCSPVLPAQAVPERCPKNSAIDFASLRLSPGTTLGSDCQMTGRGSNFDSNWNSAAWPTVYLLRNNLCGVWLLLRSVENAEIEAVSL